MERENCKIIGAKSPMGRYLEAAAEGCVFTAPTLLVTLPDGGEQGEDVLRRAEELISAGTVRQTVLISTAEVYAGSDDEELFENSRRSAEEPYARLCLKAEERLAVLCRKQGVPLAVLRPAMMFGTDIGGEGERLFRLVMSGQFFVIRDCPARRSAVCALDVARVAVTIAGADGVFNVTDGRRPRLSEIAQAMTTNAGATKRTVVLPQKWAVLLAKVADRLPRLRTLYGSETLAWKMRDRVLSDAELRKLLPDFKFFNTLEVIERRDPEYPYEYADA